ncbi:unnamed protein product [Mytilus edulis]|uniref:Uncharacterized protein n=2 Tax=Mytilus TaxID=6548 RepID=A0A8S3UMN8_MYTED|nr:unnamed protein product [Mytilus edulis]
MRFSRNRKIKLFKILGILTTALIVILYILAALKPKVTPLYANGVVEANIGDVRFDFSTGVFTFTNKEQNVYLKGFVSETLRSTSALSCKPKSKASDKNYLCLVWIRYAKLEVIQHQHDSCHDVYWTSTSRDFTPHDCFTLRGPHHWFGGSLLSSQYIPLQYAEVPMQPYITNDILFKSKVEKDRTNVFGNVVERFWINSNGVGIVVDSSVPLHVSLNESGSSLLCFKGDYNESPFPNPNNEPPFLKYTICKEDNVKKMRDFFQRTHFEKPQGIPDLSVMQKVTWSTKAKYKSGLNQNVVLKYSSNITKIDNRKTNFEIYEPYSSAYGNFDFRSDFFSNSAQMVGILKQTHSDVSAVLTPFVSVDNNTRNFAQNSALFIHDKGGKAPTLTGWYGGLVGILDFSNPKTQEWYKQNLEDMKSNFNLKNFTFHGCETNFIPSSHKSHQFLKNPCTFIQTFVSNVIKYGCQVTCGHKTQKFPVYIHLSSRDSTWSHYNGLNSIIPAVLTLGILGYPYVIPDVIGGNGFKGDNFNETLLPDRELYIRWLQVATYLPVMKFSIPPWDYDDEMVTLTKTMLEKRESILPLLEKAAREAEHYGAPIIRPLWWVSPTDQDALAVGNQFLVGETLLVAPVLLPGTTEIDIYLPEGTWHDEINDKDWDGRQWLKSYKVELHQIATFTQARTIGT